MTMGLAGGLRSTFSRGLWANHDFMRLWIGQTVSQFGSQITVVALPLVAVQALHADAGDMGVLDFLARAPFVLYLAAGVWVDRTLRRSVLIATDVARCGLVVVVIVTGVTGHLTLWLIGAAMFGTMVLTVWFETAYMSFLPALVDRADLMAGNMRLEATRTGAQVAGPSVGGLLVQTITAPLAIIVDAVSYLFSAYLVVRMRTVEKAPPKSGSGVRAIAADLGVGLRFVARHRLLRPLNIAIGVSNMAWAAEMALYIIFVVRGLGLPAGLVGLSLAGQAPGAVLGSLLAGRTQRRYGPLPSIVGGLTLFAVATLIVPLAPRSPGVAVPLLIVAGFLMSAGGQLCAVNVLTLRQSLTPDHLLGRVNASFRFISLGLSPLGALAGGFLGGAIGLRNALFIAVAGMFAAPMTLLPALFRHDEENHGT